MIRAFRHAMFFTALVNAAICTTLTPVNKAATLWAADAQATSPWSPEDTADVQLVEAAVKYSLGPLSEDFKARSFRGVTLGAAHDISQGMFHPGLMSSSEYPAPPSEEPAKGRPATDIVLVERESRKIVGIVAIYMPGTIADMADDVVSVFGKTPNAVDESTQPGGATLTTLKYLFPDSIVRVTGATFPGSVVPQVKIAVIDRSFAEESLQAYAGAVASACNWIETNMAKMEQAQPDITMVAALADTIGEYDADARVACFYDPTAKNHRFGEATEWPRPKVIDVAGCYITNEKIGFVCDPLVSESISMPRLCNHKISDDYEGIPSTLNSTTAGDLVWMTASYILQKKFPPEGTTVKVLSPGGQSPEAQAGARVYMGFQTDKDSSPLDRIRYLQFRSYCKRHEWTDKEGNLVRVGANGSFSVVARRPGSAKGL